MPDPRNRLPWKATCKVYPAVADLQACETVNNLYDHHVSGGGDIERVLGTVPAGKIWHVTMTNGHTDTSTPSKFDVYSMVGINPMYFRRQTFVVANVIYPLACDIYLDSLSDLRFVWYDTAALNELWSMAFVIQIDKY